MSEKKLAIGFMGSFGTSELSVDIDGNTITLNEPKSNDSFYIGYTSKRGKFAIYFTVKIKDMKTVKVATIDVLINDYDSGKKIKEYSITLDAEWHTFDELI